MLKWKREPKPESTMNQISIIINLCRFWLFNIYTNKIFMLLCRRNIICLALLGDNIFRFFIECVALFIKFDECVFFLG